MENFWIDQDGTIHHGNRYSNTTQVQSYPTAPPPPIYPSLRDNVDVRDATENKAMGVVAYLGPLAFVPLLARKHSPFAQFHAKQGVTLFVVNIAITIINALLRLIKVTQTNDMWGVPYEVKVTPWYISIITTLLTLGIFVLAIIGIVNAIQGRKRRLPFIGGIAR